jgi:two-component system sensor histidine kinase YesM
LKMRSNKNFLQDMKFIDKIRLTYSIIVVIPIILLGIFLFYSSSTFIKEQQIQSFQEESIRNKQDLQNQMYQCDTVMRYLVSNNSMQEFLNTEDDEYIIRNQMAKTVSPMIYNLLLSNPYYSKIRVYSEKDFSVSSDLFINASDAKETEWYQTTMGTSEMLWWYEDGEFFATRRIFNYYPQKVIGIVRIDIKPKMFTERFQVFKNTPVQISIFSEDIELYEFDNLNNKKTIYTVEYQLNDCDWNIRYQFGSEHYSSFYHPRVIASMALIFVLLWVVWIIVSVLTKKLLKDLYYLISQVKEVRDGNLDVEIYCGSKDEIGDLAVSVDEMIKRIKLLIDQVYQSEIDKKNLELNLLRSKLNPHFLYNNLSAINWIALDYGADQICQITTLMSTFYRTALNKGKTVDKVRVELENIKAYIQLQLMAHEYSFDVEYYIEDAVMDISIPTFIMQPLVENAIEHGIDLLRGTRGKIKISVFIQGKALLMHINDNGSSLYEKIGEGRLDDKLFGYGLSNVDKRVKLIYGNEYGVTVMSDKEGTCSEIRMKCNQMMLI